MTNDGVADIRIVGTHGHVTANEPCPDVSVSVMIATRNRPDHLSICLAHLARQQGVSMDVVIVDDASDYDVAAVLAPFGDKLCMTWIRLRTASGYIVARNVGIAHCSVDTIVQLDDDSWLVESDAARTAALFMASHPAVSALAMKVHFPWAGSPDGSGVGRPSPRWNRDHLSEECSFQGCAVVLKRDAALAAGGYPEHFVSYGEEDYLAIQLLRRGGKILLFGARRVVHGHDTIAAPLDKRNSERRIAINMATNMPLVYLDNMPFPLNVVCAFTMLMQRAGRDLSLFFEALGRLRSVRGKSRRPVRLTWSQAIRYLNLRWRVRHEASATVRA
jgi:glycosyltransferase involved in cell wall biosynthesis